jgi:hypothetical protein
MHGKIKRLLMLTERKDNFEGKAYINRIEILKFDKEILSDWAWEMWDAKIDIEPVPNDKSFAWGEPEYWTSHELTAFTTKSDHLTTCKWEKNAL